MPKKQSKTHFKKIRLFRFWGDAVKKARPQEL